VTEDKVGVLEQIIHLIVEEGYNIANTVNIPTKDDRVVIEVQIDGVTDLEGIRSKFEANGLKVDEIKSYLIKKSGWMTIQSDFCIR
jgi:acetoin utilization protein AcuB